MMTDHSAITLPLRGRVAQLAFLLFGCKILTTKYTKKEWIVIALAGILGSVSYFTCGDEYVLRAVVLIAAAKDIELEKTTRIWFFATLAGTALIVLLSSLGILGMLFDKRDYGRGAVEARWCFGFSHANNVHVMLWYLSALYLFIRKEKSVWWEYAALLLADILLYKLTASRTGLLATAILVMGAAMFRYLPKLNYKKWIYGFGFLALAACMGLTVIGSLYGIESAFVRFFDRFLTQRLNMTHELSYIGNWKLFPSENTIEGAVDNGFAAFFYEYGIVCGILFLLLLVLLLLSQMRMGQGLSFLILLTYMLVFFMERTFVFNTSLLCNLFFLLLFNQWPNLLCRGVTNESV